MSPKKNIFRKRPRHIAVNNIGKRKYAEKILQARLRITEFAAEHPFGDLLQNALDELCALTDSPVGFFHFVEPDQRTLSLQAWSTRTLKEMCTAEGKGRHYDIDQAGIWVDCVREGRPVIHNDYANLAHRKGLPEGHAPMIRYRYANHLPLCGDNEAIQVNWVELIITHEETGEVTFGKNAFITDFEVKETTVEALVRDGRARWKVENDTALAGCARETIMS